MRQSAREHQQAGGYSRLGAGLQQVQLGKKGVAQIFRLLRSTHRDPQRRVLEQGPGEGAEVQTDDEFVQPAPGVLLGRPLVNHVPLRP